MNSTRPNSRAWLEIPAADNGDAVVAAMAAAGVEFLFFTSGAEISFYQEAIAKASAEGRTTPKLISVTHEHASLNAALGCAAVSRKPVATAAHVDCGTQHYGGAIHTAWHAALPVLITAGLPPVAYPGSMPGARDPEGGHVWLQQAFDQNGIVRQYTKWDYQLKLQDNPGLMVSRAMQVACSEPQGPVYLSIPPEVSFAHRTSIHFPTAEQLGLAKPAAPDDESIREIADRLTHAQNPMIVVARSGRNPDTVAPLVRLCERLGLPVVSSTKRAYHCFPLAHPLYQSEISLKEADFVLALEVDIPWKIGAEAPADEAYVAIIDPDPSKVRIPTMEFTADLRVTADSLRAIESIDRAVAALTTPSDHARFSARSEKWADVSAARRRKLEETARSFSTNQPIDRRWLSYVIGQTLGDDCIVFDDTIVLNQIHDYLRCSRPGSYFYNPGSSGGWAPGAAFGAKLAAPERDVVAVTGDGFYMFGAPVHALWSAGHYSAPYLTIIYQNRSYTTGTLRVARNYPDGFAARAGYPGGYFDPPIDFALEAQAAGAYGENVVDPDQVEPAIQRGLQRTRSGQCAVISVRLPRLLQAE